MKNYYIVFHKKQKIPAVTNWKEVSRAKILRFFGIWFSLKQYQEIGDDKCQFFASFLLVNSQKDKNNFFMDILHS